MGACFQGSPLPHPDNDKLKCTWFTNKPLYFSYSLCQNHTCEKVYMHKIVLMHAYLTDHQLSNGYKVKRLLCAKRNIGKMYQHVHIL